MAKDWTEENLDAQESAVMDIVERLREWQNDDGSIEGLMTGAADEIEKLREERNRLREALNILLNGVLPNVMLTREDYRLVQEARTALKERE